MKMSANSRYMKIHCSLVKYENRQSSHSPPAMGGIMANWHTPPSWPARWRGASS